MPDLKIDQKNFLKILLQVQGWAARLGSRVVQLGWVARYQRQNPNPGIKFLVPCLVLKVGSKGRHAESGNPSASRF
jgi:hypothetical protein